MKKNSWSSWSEYLNVSSTDDLEELSEKPVPQSKSDVMKLPFKDKDLFGYCPEYEDFYLVVCKICGKSLKPQSLSFHMKNRHPSKSLHKNSVPESVQEAHLVSPKYSNEKSRNEDRLTRTASKICSFSRTEDKVIMSNKRHVVYVQPYSRPSSINSCQEKAGGKLTSYSPSASMVRPTVTRNIPPENLNIIKNACVRKVSSPSSSLSTCDSKTSMTVFLRHSFLMPNMKLCDIKDQCTNHLQCLNTKALPNNSLSKATLITQVFPEKRTIENVQSPQQHSQVHHYSEGISDWSSIQNNSNLDFNGVAYSSWNQHSSHFRPLPHTVPITKSGQMNAHSFNYPDLTKNFGDLESQVLIHNAAMGT